MNGCTRHYAVEYDPKMNRITRRQFVVQSSLVAAAAGARPRVSPAAESPSSHGDLSELTAVQAVSAMRNGDIKAETYADALLARAEKLKALNAFITLRPDEVRRAAREADQRRARGEEPGLLHGFPIAVKDSVDTKSLPTSNGSRSGAYSRAGWEWRGHRSPGSR